MNNRYSRDAWAEFSFSFVLDESRALAVNTHAISDIDGLVLLGGFGAPHRPRIVLIEINQRAR